jgi:hypothetical protein
MDRMQNIVSGVIGEDSGPSGHTTSKATVTYPIHEAAVLCTFDPPAGGVLVVFFTSRSAQEATAFLCDKIVVFSN